VTARILLEVTEFQQSRHSYRHLSGVPRTVMEIGRRLLDDDELEVEVEPFFYNAHADDFYLADRRLFDEEGPSIPDAGPGGRSRVAGAARAVRRAAGVVRRSRPFHGAYRSARRRLALARGGRPVAFRPDDVVLVLGAMWGSRELPSALAQRQHAVGFRAMSLLYDLIPIEYPQYYDEGFAEQYRHYLDRVLAMSDRLLVISRSTERDLDAYREEHGIEARPTRVVPLGDGAVPTEGGERPRGLPEGDFVLAVSTFEPRKNHQLLYQAVKHAQLHGIPLPRVVVAGSPGWSTRELQFVVRTDPGIRDAFVWLPRTTDRELAWLYRHALFTVYPSIAEGWGLPIAESMHFGRFCITSGVSSMPEVAGDLVDYLSPYDPAAWARTISRYGSDPAALREREARIAAEYVSRSWDDTARAVTDFLQDGPTPPTD
jgi:glycosyltransferase involved in cell wall biosynthesis